ncbi:VOC family protein [Kribbella sp. NPDC048915]|uniref:VOC family protein n=1 Tax=Kribbella sp. NPDC048915 TaxID=3155148 RepID=UPI0033E94474
MMLRHVTIDAGNPYELAQFWSAVTGWPVAGNDQSGDDEVLIEAPAPAPGLLYAERFATWVTSKAIASRCPRVRP